MWIFLPHRKLGKSTIYIGKKWSPHHKLIFHITHFDICVSRYIFVPNFFFLFLSKVNTKWNIKTLLSLSTLSPLSTHTLSLSLTLHLCFCLRPYLSFYIFISISCPYHSLSLYLSIFDWSKEDIFRHQFLLSCHVRTCLLWSINPKRNLDKFIFYFKKN